MDCWEHKRCSQQLDKGNLFIDPWVVPGLYIKIPNHVLEIPMNSLPGLENAFFLETMTNLATD